MEPAYSCMALIACAAYTLWRLLHEAGLQLYGADSGRGNVTAACFVLLADPHFFAA
jgi:hypothetical protein